MAQPYVGEIKMFAGNFAPAGWAFCDGSELPISEYETLFNLIGTTYGGDGQSTFRLPDLRGRVPVHMGTNNYGTYNIGQGGGAETVALIANQIPSHSHVPQCSSGSGIFNKPLNNYWGAAASAKQFTDQAPNAQMSASALLATGSGLAHENRLPYLSVNFIISLFGIYPSAT
jgi:microcystin-dependent protein